MINIKERLVKLGYLKTKEEKAFFRKIKDYAYMKKLLDFSYLINEFKFLILNITDYNKIMNYIEQFNNINDKILLYDTYFNMLKGYNKIYKTNIGE